MLNNNRSKIILILLLVIILGITIYFNFNFCYEKFDSEFDTIIDKFVYYDENNNKINHKELELEEQSDAFHYIDKDDIVLELGARYGTVSNMIAYKQENSGKLVVIEPDKNIIDALKKNKEINNGNFIILNKFISNKNKTIEYNGYGTLIKNNDSNKKNEFQISYGDFKKEYPLKFNVLIADCEGCLYDFIEMIGDDIHNYNKILFEADQEHMCDYNAIINKLLNIGFKQVKSHFKDVTRYVFIK